LPGIGGQATARGPFAGQPRTVPGQVGGGTFRTLTVGQSGPTTGGTPRAGGAGGGNGQTKAKKKNSRGGYPGGREKNQPGGNPLGGTSFGFCFRGRFDFPPIFARPKGCLPPPAWEVLFPAGLVVRLGETAREARPGHKTFQKKKPGNAKCITCSMATISPHTVPNCGASKSTKHAVPLSKKRRGAHTGDFRVIFFAL